MLASFKFSFPPRYFEEFICSVYVTPSIRDKASRSLSNLHQSTGAGGCNDVPARHLELHHHPVVDEQQHPAVDDEQQGHGTRRSLPCMLPILLNVEPSK